MKSFLTVALCLITYSFFAQVGIGTTIPNAALDIQSPSDNLPALELNPQIAPVGSAMGQLSVIGDQLYLYDDVRVKWLSVGAATFNFGRDGNNDNRYLEYAGDIDDSGPRMPRDGTIVYVTMNSSGGNATKTGTIEITDAGGTTTNTSIALIGGRRIYEDFNVDFGAGDELRVRLDAAGSGSLNTSVILWVKWRN